MSTFAWVNIGFNKQIIITTFEKRFMSKRFKINCIQKNTYHQDEVKNKLVGG